ncbi:hypothetical protein [Nonomuraea rhodomycinica]|uniref:Heavy-metal-associated domain-containing protein n=1 Tax=Nonomuraea rhodomycinica TaxID=1712872 RepID=A0A7Y6MEU0_9ACTN|nr:hypothetical protein [Nonomuraea rhodomycinica]NUW45918.1 hypothetical protein [Nonomuraea rhodomycinica]
MNTAGRLGLYALGLAVVFGGALGAGNALGDAGAVAAGAKAPAAHAATGGPAAHGEQAAHGQQNAQGHGDAAQAGSEDTPGGLQVSENGYTLVPLTDEIKPGEPADFRFAVTGPGGGNVTDFETRHDKRLHLIVTSRDLTTFQHVHPEMSADGVWTVKLTLPEAGPYRAFADFAPTGGPALTLGTDVFVAGGYTPRPLPAAARTATVDGYTVELIGDLAPGRSSRLALKVSKGGEPVTDLQPYLGAYGHLVALRGGDLAYLHVHPDGEPGDGVTKAGPEIVFYAQAPSGGDYRLFLDFQHEGKVRTAAFTVHAGSPGATPEPSGTPAGTPSAGPADHDDQGPHGH